MVRGEVWWRTTSYPTLAEDVGVLDRVVGPVFTESDTAALWRLRR
jgi:hypothetical protein